MPRSYRVILLLSAAITAFLFIHDYLYDVPARPYTAGQYAEEIIIGGGMYTGIIFGLLTGLWYVVCKLCRLVRR